MRKLITILLICAVILAGCAQNDSEGASTQVAAGESPSPSASESSSASVPMIKPEQIISKEEAAQLLGEAVKEPSSQEQQLLGMSICVYAAEKADSKGYLQVVLIQKEAMSSGKGGSEGSNSESGGSGSSGGSGGSGDSGGSSGSGGSGESGGQGDKGSKEEMEPKTLFEALKKMFADPNAQGTGLMGDDAFISAKGISILADEAYIYVVAGTTDPAMAEQATMQAAELAVSNLKRIQGE